MADSDAAKAGAEANATADAVLLTEQADFTERAGEIALENNLTMKDFEGREPSGETGYTVKDVQDVLAERDAAATAGDDGDSGEAINEAADEVQDKPEDAPGAQPTEQQREDHAAAAAQANPNADRAPHNAKHVGEISRHSATADMSAEERAEQRKLQRDEVAPAEVTPDPKAELGGDARNGQDVSEGDEVVFSAGGRAYLATVTKVYNKNLVDLDVQVGGRQGASRSAAVAYGAHGGAGTWAWPAEDTEADE